MTSVHASLGRRLALFLIGLALLARAGLAPERSAADDADELSEAAPVAGMRLSDDSWAFPHVGLDGPAARSGVPMKAWAIRRVGTRIYRGKPVDVYRRVKVEPDGTTSERVTTRLGTASSADDVPYEGREDYIDRVTGEFVGGRSRAADEPARIDPGTGGCGGGR